MEEKKKQELIEKLRAKNWPEKDIQKTVRIMESREYVDKSNSNVSSSRILYWTALLVLMVCNLLITVFLVPFLLVLGGTLIYIIIAVIGFVFGLFFNLLLRDIENLEAHHHLFATIFIPLLSLLNIALMTTASARIAEIINVSFKLNPAIMSVFYVSAFMLPYLYGMFKYELSKFKY
ncbi:hypothetical protein J4206_00095 [Candidatus Woesearchaeota archaeon]|nr:hypothetical protein [Candidatus Woesearchaeota archaeon]